MVSNKKYLGVINNLKNKCIYIHDLRNKIDKMELEYNLLFNKYNDLFNKYNDLLNKVSSKDSELYVYNGDVYKPTEIIATKSTGEIDTLDVCFKKVEKTKGLIDTIKDVSKVVDNIMYGSYKE